MMAKRLLQSVRLVNREEHGKEDSRLVNVVYSFMYNYSIMEVMYEYTG